MCAFKCDVFPYNLLQPGTSQVCVFTRGLKVPGNLDAHSLASLQFLHSQFDGFGLDFKGEIEAFFDFDPFFIARFADDEEIEIGIESAAVGTVVVAGGKSRPIVSGEYVGVASEGQGVAYGFAQFPAAPVENEG